MRLRPHGKKGPLASPLALMAEYYSPGGGAAPFERQALLKLRPVAGDPELGRRVMAVRDAFVWSGEPWDREDALHLRERQATELVPAGRVNVKYSRGCMVDTEYAVQYLQLLHAGEREELRTPTTLEGLERLRDAGLVSREDAADLRSSYRFWRRLADAQRMVHGAARDLLLPEPGERGDGLPRPTHGLRRPQRPGGGHGARSPTSSATASAPSPSSTACSSTRPEPRGAGIPPTRDRAGGSPPARSRLHVPRLCGQGSVRVVDRGPLGDAPPPRLELRESCPR